MAKLFRPGDERDILVTKWEIQYKDVYHLKNFYKLAYEFLNEKGWSDPRGGKYWEQFYYEKIHPGTGLKEHRFRWRLQMIPNDSKYIRYLIKMDVRTLIMKQVDTVYEGKKFKTWSGEISLFCEAWLQLDYNNTWGKSPLLKSFDKFFRERIYKDQWENHKLELYQKCYEFNRELKKYLQLKTPVQEQKLFRGETGVPA